MVNFGCAAETSSLQCGIIFVLSCLRPASSGRSVWCHADVPATKQVQAGHLSSCNARDRKHIQHVQRVSYLSSRSLRTSVLIAAMVASAVFAERTSPKMRINAATAALFTSLVFIAACRLSA